MGRNRKFVLADDLQQAVWRTILRGPRPPSAKWEKRSSPSAVSKSSQSPRKQERPKPGKVSVAPSKVQRESVSPDEVQRRARQSCIHEVLLGKVRETGRGRASGRRKDQRRVGEGRGLVGEGGGDVEGRAPAVASVVGGGEGDGIAFRTTSQCRSCLVWKRDQSDAGHHRQFARRVGQVAKEFGSGFWRGDELISELSHAKKSRSEGGACNSWL